jgi:hypothetical protein
MRSSLVLLAVCLTAFAGCSTFEEAYGRPDPTRWTYFEGTADEVVQAIAQTLNEGPLRVEGARDEADGTVLTISDSEGSSDISQILVQATDVEEFGARAQIYPRRRPLPRWLEIEITGRI